MDIFTTFPRVYNLICVLKNLLSLFTNNVYLEYFINMNDTEVMVFKLLKAADTFNLHNVKTRE